VADINQLKKILSRIDGRGYKAYQDLKGSYQFPGFQLIIDHIQGDPYASPSRLRARVPMAKAQFPSDLYEVCENRIAIQDYLARCFNQAIQAQDKNRKAKGSTGPSGQIYIDSGKQEILERSSIIVCQEFVEARFSMGLPARGRTILGRQAETMLCEDVPALVNASLFWKHIDQGKARKNVETNYVQENLREQLTQHNLVAFLANQSILPRESGISDRPMKSGEALPFQAPESLRVSLENPFGGQITGMGIPEGVTLIVGGGYHGKSTLLQAVERGIFNHIPGDGRELVVTRDDAVKIRSEDGRRVARVDISPFIGELPGGRDTRDFASDDASGSTSQAANIMEALEVGTHLLLMDEDTSATNFMIRDARMQSLVAKEREPITPFIDKVSSLYQDLSVSTLLVIGGSGDYFDVADTVIMMSDFHPEEVTEQAKKIARQYKTGRTEEGTISFGEIRMRVPDPKSFNPQKGKKNKIGARGAGNIQFGRENIDLSYLEQLVDPGQARAIGDLIYYLLKQGYMDGNKSLREALEQGYKDLGVKGLEVISPFFGQHPGEYAYPRPQEAAAAINRLRTLRINKIK